MKGTKMKIPIHCTYKYILKIAVKNIRALNLAVENAPIPAGRQNHLHQDRMV